jgi:hypothetical protein
MPKDGAFADVSGGSQGQIGPRNEASADNNKTKSDAEKGLEEVVVKQRMVPWETAATKEEARMSPQQPPNQIVQFPKPDHQVFSSLGQKKTSRTIAPGMTRAPRWCPLGVTLS